MDPKNNANPVASDDDQKNTPADASQDAMPNLGTETPTTDGTSTEAPAVPPTSEPAADPNKLPDDLASAGITPDTTTPTADAQPSIASEEPAAPATPATPDMTPPAADTTPTMPTDTVPGSTDPVPPTAPTPVPGNDKKTIMVLGGVAAVLLIAIAVLYFVV